ncbi:helix-turn-helix domain-containing protein [Bradyrhizobium pachyrhizi]|uniref:helix-turn-helix domain-containing protein n=1 Tax=Bradyrhizobium pachyrhizi TaxID=280333 RepID=UPI0024B0E529|nr:helix-turn-helix domain-containing protein [Bradyrhizobium pachyrhizi]WFU53027.1 helix-turn-helix domain-containing protein [Bradyrhizobium pachyrhizi]
MTEPRDDTTPLKNPSTFKARDAWISAVLVADLPHATARVAAAIAMHLNVKAGICNPGSQTLADASRVSKRSIYRHVELLERTGWIEAERTAGILNQFYLLTSAKPMAPVAQQTSAKPMARVLVTNSTSTGDTALSPDQCHTVAAHKERRTKRTAKRAKKDSRAVARVSEHPDFDRWYAAYPRRVGRLAAAKAYQKAVDQGASPAELLNGAMRFAAECDRDRREARFIPHPATWLNAGRWMDEQKPASRAISSYDESILRGLGFTDDGSEP